MITLKSVRQHLTSRGITIRRTDDGEYRVNYRHGREATAYYTDDLDDAHTTGLDMAAIRDKENT
jgi:hypothetical protein